jgi:hypothetical protein
LLKKSNKFGTGRDCLGNILSYIFGRFIVLKSVSNVLKIHQYYLFYHIPNAYDENLFLNTIIFFTFYIFWSK